MADVYGYDIECDLSSSHCTGLKITNTYKGQAIQGEVTQHTFSKSNTIVKNFRKGEFEISDIKFQDGYALKTLKANGSELIKNYNGTYSGTYWPDSDAENPAELIITIEEKARPSAFTWDRTISPGGSYQAGLAPIKRAEWIALVNNIKQFLYYKDISYTSWEYGADDFNPGEDFKADYYNDVVYALEELGYTGFKLNGTPIKTVSEGDTIYAQHFTALTSFLATIK